MRRLSGINPLRVRQLQIIINKFSGCIFFSVALTFAHNRYVLRDLESSCSA